MAGAVAADGGALPGPAGGCSASAPDQPGRRHLQHCGGAVALRSGPGSRGGAVRQAAGAEGARRAPARRRQAAGQGQTAPAPGRGQEKEMPFSPPSQLQGARPTQTRARPPGSRGPATEVAGGVGGEAERRRDDRRGCTGQLKPSIRRRRARHGAAAVQTGRRRQDGRQDSPSANTSRCNQALPYNRRAANQSHDHTLSTGRSAGPSGPTSQRLPPPPAWRNSPISIPPHKDPRSASVCRTRREDRQQQVSAVRRSTGAARPRRDREHRRRRRQPVPRPGGRRVVAERPADHRQRAGRYGVSGPVTGR